MPDVAFKLALERLRNFVGNAQDPAKDGGRNLAYALYVLARNGAAPIGDLRYYADTKLDAFATPIAKAQLAAALAMLGDRTRAERIYAAALASISQPPAPNEGRTDYGSVLRDAAALVTLASEGGAPSATIIECGAAGRERAQPDGLHVDAGERLDGAGRPRARQGRAERVARCRTASARKARSTAICARPISPSRSR